MIFKGANIIYGLAPCAPTRRWPMPEETMFADDEFDEDEDFDEDDDFKDD